MDKIDKISLLLVAAYIFVALVTYGHAHAHHCRVEVVEPTAYQISSEQEARAITSFLAAALWPLHWSTVAWDSKC